MAFWHPSPSRLHAPRHFERHLRHLLDHLPPDADAFPAASMLAREAPFLQEQYRRLKKELKGCPPLPAEGKAPRLLLIARRICNRLPLHKGRMLLEIRGFYQDQDMLCREKDMLPAALSLALLEQVQEQIEHALHPEKDEVLLLRQRSCALTLQALHEAALFSYASFLEHICPVSGILKADDTFRRMDRESRKYYVQRVCRLARRYCVPETAVARAALALCEGKEGLEKEAGYYLLEQPQEIAVYLLKPGRSLSPGQKTLLFLLPFAGAALLCCLGWAYFSLPAVFLLVGLPAVSQHARQAFAFLLCRFSPPRMLPRLHPNQVREKRLLVVVPAHLSNEKQAFSLARHLRTLHAATPSAHFMLLADFSDGPEALSDADQALFRTAAAIFQALNQQEENAYLYFHRSRIFNESRGIWQARHHPWGALESLNLLLAGKECPDAFVYTSLSPSALAHRYDHVICLHPDTFLPPGAAVQLQGALEHPLQKGRIALIRPRTETPASSLSTRLQFFLNRAGIASPESAAETLYQAVFQKGSFFGQGIYDPNRYLQKMQHLPADFSRVFMENELAGSALAGDIVCLTPLPATLARLQQYIRRQIADSLMLLPLTGDTGLSFLSRFKIYDRLRSSLVPLSELALLMGGALAQNPFLMLLGLPYPFSGMVRRLCLLPGTVFIQLDAAVRFFFRRHISGKTAPRPAAPPFFTPGMPFGCLLFSMLSGAAVMFACLLPGGVWPGLVPGLCFVLPPLFIASADRKQPLHPPLTEEDRQSLRSLCRDTWHFFEKNVHQGTANLPPDAVRHQPDPGPDRHTSPASMGLYLLSVLAAREVNLISTAQMLRRMLRTTETMERLETWQGHFFSTYHLENLLPAPERHVFTTGSGILCACLLTCAQGVRQHITALDTAAHSLAQRLDRLAHRMRFDALYDPGPGLFFTGYDAAEHRFLSGHHDLLADESRLASYAAIALGQVPLKHWFRLRRPLTRQGGGAALLSLHGSASAYLMPGLMLPLFPRTLLHEGCLNALRAQIAAAAHRPFGISESACYAFDPRMRYQTRPFGLAGLALKPEEGQVVAPYASMLALPYLPGAALRNLHRMRKLAWYAEDGLYEAADYAPGPMEAGPRLVESHTASHQAMILCAACNALTDFALVRHFMHPSPIRAFQFLLCEATPTRPRLSRPLPKPAFSHASSYDFTFPAPLHFPSGALPLFGNGTLFLMDSRGNCLFERNHVPVTPFFPPAPCGPQFYLRHAKTGSFIRPQAQGQMTFESGCIRIAFRAFGLKGCMRFFVLPLDGTLVTDLVLENTGTLDEQADAVSFLPLFPDAAGNVSIRSHGENALICHCASADNAISLLCHSLAGDVQGIRRQGDAFLFLGREGSYPNPAQLQMPPDQARYRLEAAAAPCLSLTGRLSIPAGESAHVQFVTRPARLEADLPDTEPLLPPSAFSLCQTYSRMTLRYLQLSPAALPLYARMMGCLFFSPPLPRPYPPASARSLKTYGLSGKHPLLSVHVRQTDRALIRHVLFAHAFFETAGLETELLFLCEPETMPAVHTLMEQMRAGRERIRFCEADEAEAARISSLSGLHLKSGAPLAAQLDALASPWNEDTLLIHAPWPEEAPPLQFLKDSAGFTEEMDYCLFAPSPIPCRNLSAGRCFGTYTCETAVLHSFFQDASRHPITRISPDPLHPERAEEYLLIRDKQAASLTGGLVFHRPGVTQYQCRLQDVHSKLTVFSHLSLPAGQRLITLQSPAEVTCTLRCTVHFAGIEGITATRMEAPFVYAAFSHQEGCAFAHMENAALFTVSPCYAKSPDAASFHMEGSHTAIYEMPVHLLPHRPLSFCLTLGRARDEQDARHIMEALQQQGPGDALRQMGLFWQDTLERLLLFGGLPPLKPCLNRWLPYQARMEMPPLLPRPSEDAFALPEALLSLLSSLHTDAPYVRQQLLLHAGHSGNGLFLPFLTALYTDITGDKAVLLEKLPLPHAPSLLQLCCTFLSGVEWGPHGLPLTRALWGNPQSFQKIESVSAGFFLCMVYQRMAPLCDTETGKKLTENRRKTLQDLEQAWTGEGYRPGWDHAGHPLAPSPSASLICACLSCLAGAPREHARLAMHHAFSFPPSPEIAPLAVSALCNIGAHDSAWQTARAALPFFRTETDEAGEHTRSHPHLLSGCGYSGHAAALYYVYITALLGLEKKGDQVRLMPCPGGETEEFSLVLRHHSAAYHLTASRDILFPTLDGERIKNGWVSLRDDARTHEALFPHRKA